MKPGDTFIPYHVFDGEFIDVVSEMDILSRSEKRFLIVLNSYCYKNGHCYPSQVTIGRMMGSKKYGGPGRDMSTRQVRNIQNALVDRGFLEVERSSLIARHLLRKSNRYRFVWHEAYAGFVSAENSAKVSAEISGNAPIYTSPQILTPQSTADAGLSIDDHESETRREINTLTETIADMLPSGHKFDPGQFAGWAENHFPVYPLEVVQVSLEAIRKRIIASGSGGELWGYGVSVIKGRGPSLSAEEDRAEARSMSDRLGEWVGGLSTDTPMGLAIGAVVRGSSL